MKMMIAKIAGLAIAAMLAVTGVSYAAGGPKIKPKEVDWSFAGPFGVWDLGQLQRGFKVYKDVCSGCHSIDLIAFRNLTEIGYSENQVKALIDEDDIEIELPNDETRKAVLADHIPGPDVSGFEVIPPDLSLMAKSRAVERGFPTFVFDMFTLYAENGPDYIYSLLTGYKDASEAPADLELSEDDNYNPYFISGPVIGMAAPISDNSEEEDFYSDGTVASVEQQAKDVSAFLMWTAEPYLVERKAMGFKVIIFLLIFSVLLYLTKKSVFRQLKSA